MPKPSKQIIIDAIIKEIESGKATEKICAAICRKFQFSPRTFYNHHKKAIIQHTVKQEAIKKELAEVDKQAAVEARKRDIMTADERKEYLTKIVSGEAKVRKPFYVAKTGKILEYLAEPDHNDRIRALAELNKMEGDYAPTKIDTKHSGEVSVKQITGMQIL